MLDSVCLSYPPSSLSRTYLELITYEGVLTHFKSFPHGCESNPWVPKVNGHLTALSKRKGYHSGSSPGTTTISSQGAGGSQRSRGAACSEPKGKRLFGLVIHR